MHNLSMESNKPLNIKALHCSSESVAECVQRRRIATVQDPMDRTFQLLRLMQGKGRLINATLIWNLGKAGLYLDNPPPLKGPASGVLRAEQRL